MKCFRRSPGLRVALATGFTLVACLVAAGQADLGMAASDAADHPER